MSEAVLPQISASYPSTSTQVHIAVNVADTQAHQAFDTTLLELPGQEVSGLSLERIDAGPGKATFIEKAGFIFLADCDQQCVGWTDHFRIRRPLTLHAPQQCVNGCARNLVPAGAGTAAITMLEQHSRIAEVLLHLGFGYIRDGDFPLSKMGARIGQ